MNQALWENLVIINSGSLRQVVACQVAGNFQTPLAAQLLSQAAAVLWATIWEPTYTICSSLLLAGPGLVTN